MSIIWRQSVLADGANPAGWLECAAQAFTTAGVQASDKTFSKADRVDKPLLRWDHPTMTIAIADQKKRVVLPGASPGDVFDVQRSEDGRYVLVKLVRPPVAGTRSATEVRAALDSAPLTPRMSWEALKRLTREP